MINPIEIKLALMNNRTGLTSDELKQAVQNNTGHYPAPNELMVAINRCKSIGTIEFKNGKYFSITSKRISSATFKNKKHDNKFRRDH